MALSRKMKLEAIAAVNDGWIPVTKALPETGIQVIVTTSPKRGPRYRAINKAWIDEQGKWHDVRPGGGLAADPSVDG